MAVGDPQLRYATHTELADGIKTDFEVNFVGGYINPDHVLCVSVVVDEETNLATDRQIHTTEIISQSGNAATVRVAPAVEAGRTVIIFRDTTKTAMLVQYLDGSLLTKDNLDLANKQLLMLIQEILDGLNENSLDLNEAISTIIDLNEIIRNIYEEVIELLENSGIIAIEPRVWHGVGDGITQDFPLFGADVADPGFYDTYVSGLGVIPNEDYTVLLNDTPEDTLLHFEEPPADGAVWFTVLRGYARPANPQGEPILSLDIPVFDAEGPTFHADEAVKWGLVRCTYGGGCLVTVKEINLMDEERMRTGSYVSFMQRGVGPVTVQGDPDVTLSIPGGCLPQTRALHSVVTVTCEDEDSNLWVLSGDLAQE